MMLSTIATRRTTVTLTAMAIFELLLSPADSWFVVLDSAVVVGSEVPDWVVLDADATVVDAADAVAVVNVVEDVFVEDIVVDVVIGSVVEDVVVESVEFEVVDGVVEIKEEVAETTTAAFVTVLVAVIGSNVSLSAEVLATG